MAKIYRFKVDKIDSETGDKEEILNEEYSGFTLLADSLDGEGMTEIMVHDSIGNLASKMAAGEKTCIAARVATILIEHKRKEAFKFEDLLIGMIDGGKEDE